MWFLPGIWITISISFLLSATHASNQAEGEPKFDFAESSFNGLDGMKLRDQVQKTTVQSNPSMDKYAQVPAL